VRTERTAKQSLLLEKKLNRIYNVGVNIKKGLALAKSCIGKSLNDLRTLQFDVELQTLATEKELGSEAEKHRISPQNSVGIGTPPGASREPESKRPCVQDSGIWARPVKVTSGGGLRRGEIRILGKLVGGESETTQGI